MITRMLGTTFTKILSGLALSGSLVAYAADGPAPVVGEPAAVLEAGDLGIPCGSCCESCCTGSLFANVEATFFRYHRADGVRTGDAVNPNFITEFGFELAPRVTVGYVGCDGLGVSLRWWDYNHNNPAANAANQGVGVDTYTIDFEVFENIQLSCATSMQVSFGIRYNDFEETIVDTDTLRNIITAWGGIGAVEFRRQLGAGLLSGCNDCCGGNNGAVYGRLRGGILMSDRQVNDLTSATFPRVYDMHDVVVGVAEIAFGYEVSQCLSTGQVLTLRAGVEWQMWLDYVEGLDVVLPAAAAAQQASNAFEGPTSIGFGGFVVGAGLSF